MAQINSHLATVQPFPGPVVDFNFFKKAATAIVYQELVAGVLNTIAIQGNNGVVIVNQATALGTNNVIINAAIVYVNALGGGSLFIEQSNYLLAASVLPLTNVFIYGAGPDTVLDGQNLAHAIDINNQNYIQISDLTCQTTPGGVALINGINIQGGCQFIKISTVLIAMSDQDGIAITNAEEEIWIRDTAIMNTDRFGINCDGNDVFINGCHISGVIGDDGIFLDANSDGCFVYFNEVEAWTGEPIDDDGDNTVVTNRCVAAGVPVVAWNSKGCGFATIQETIDHQAGNGEIRIVAGTFTVAAGVISLDAADSSLKIRGAGMVVTTLSSSAGTCLDINAAINIQIEDLSVQTTGVGANDALVVRGASGVIHLTRIACPDAGQDAVSIAAAAANVFMQSLDLSGPGAGAIARYGVNIAGDNCKLSLSRINNTGNDGIWLQAGGTFNNVSLNRVSGWVGEGIDNDDPSNSVNHNITNV